MPILILIFLLTVIDILFTYYGLSLGVIREANPIIATLIHINSMLTVFIVISYAALACLFLYWVRHKVSWLQPVLNCLLAVKIGVMMLHIGWLLGSYQRI